MEEHNREFTLDGAFGRLLEPIRKTLERIESRLEEDRSGGEQPPPPPQYATPADFLTPADDLAGDGQEETVEMLDNPWLAQLRDSAMSPEVDDSAWERILLGDTLCSDPLLDSLRQEFLQGVIAGDTTVRTLAGHLLLVQAAEPNKLPELLRPLGEAYYGWRPRKTPQADPLEQALVDWLNRLAEQAGLGNSIQLVRPGDRFDHSKHTANGRGVEVVEVHGWIVLRGNNRVYTKANVTVK